MNRLRNLVWTYFWMLMFEGAVRKWGPDALNAPLLLVRDPIVLWIYFEAYRNRLSFRNGFIAVNSFLAVATVLTATVAGYANVLVTIYGFLADFFQIPLIFLLPQIFDRDDVLRMGKWMLIIVIPETLLTVLQFKSDPLSVWNKGAMATHYDTVRPSGFFSYSNGLAYYYALMSAFLFYGYTNPRTYKWWLLVTVTLFTLLAGGCSGSRALIVSVGLVLAVAIACSLLQGRGGGGLIIAAVVVGLAALVLANTSVAHTGTDQLAKRFQDAGAHEGGAMGLVERYLSEFGSGFAVIPDIPFFGYGLGAGTNGAGVLFDFRTISADFPWVENEWERIVSECGPVFGLAICFYRVALTVYLGRAALRAARRDNMLPALIFAACGLLVVNGQWGGPVPLGFAIFGAGLTLAACHVPEEEWDDDYGEGYDEHEHDHLEDEPSHAHDPG